MIEPEHINELVRLTKAGALTWRQTWGGGGDATAEDGVCRWTLLEDNKTLIRVGLNPRDVDTVGLSRSSERYIETILATVVNSVVLRAVAPPAASPPGQVTAGDGAQHQGCPAARVEERHTDD